MRFQGHFREILKLFSRHKGDACISTLEGIFIFCEMFWKSNLPTKTTFQLSVYNIISQEPITWSLRLPHIPVTAFSQTDLFLV